MGKLKIGFGDEIVDENGDLLDHQQKEQTDYVPSQTEVRDVYLSPERLEFIRSQFDCVVVHEFGDEYHLTEEERIAKNEFYEAFKVIRKAKRSYRKLDEFVVVMREALRCLDLVANSNSNIVYTPDEFKRKFLRNKIYINGLTLPKYKGRDRKDLSWEFITEFILSDKDPKEILPKEVEYLDEDEIKEKALVLFTEDELNRIINASNSNNPEILASFDSTQDSQDGLNVAVVLNEKVSKTLTKNNPEILNILKDIRRSQESSEHLNTYAYELSSEDLEHIEAYDRKHNYKTVGGSIPEFKGDLFNDDDYNRYMYQLQEYEDECIKENYHGKMKTRSEINELQLKSVFEDNNWNIRNLYNNREREKKLSEALKKDREREKKLKKQLTDIKKRKKRRMGDETPEKKGKKKKGDKRGKKNKGYG